MCRQILSCLVGFTSSRPNAVRGGVVCSLRRPAHANLYMPLPTDHRQRPFKRIVSATQETRIRRFISDCAADDVASNRIAVMIYAKFGVAVASRTVRKWRSEELAAARARLDDEADLALLRQVADIRESLSAIAPKVEAGKLAAIDRQIALLEREAKLLGLDGRLGKRTQADRDSVVLSVVGVSSADTATERR